MNAQTTDNTKTGMLLDADELARFTVEIEPELVKLCKDFGSHTQEAKTIYMTSRNIVRKIVDDETPEDRVRQRCVVATGDPGLAGIMQFNHDPIDAGVKAIKNCRLVECGVRPALIVGTPVWFVNAARSKELIRKLDVPSITCVGTRGGTPIAVACVNELIAIGEKRRM